MKRSSALLEECPLDRDYLSILPDDIIDYVCTFCPPDEPFFSLVGSTRFQVFERCVRLSGVSRSHQAWFKRSLHQKDVAVLLSEVLALYRQSPSLLKRIFRLTEKSIGLKNALYTLLCMPENIDERENAC